MRPLTIISLLGIGLVLGAVPPLCCAGQQEAAEYEKRLSKIKEEIESLKNKIAGEEKKEKSVLSALDRIGFTKSLIKKEQSLLSVQLDKNRLESKAINKTIPELQAKLDREKESLAKILVTLYKYGRVSFVRFILQSADLKSLLGENKYMAVLAASQERMIAEFTKNVSNLVMAEESLKAKERDIQDLLRRANAKKTELEAQEKKNRALMDEIRTNKKTHEQTLEELSLRARQLQELLQKLEKQEFLLPFPLVPFYEKKGKLPWPAGGKVVQPFGIQRHPRFNTVTMNNGIEIAPPKNDLTVRAVHPGKVVFADYFQGYGNLLIVDHGMTYYSLYGHCSAFLVQNGDIVRTDQPIAEAGETGSLAGNISLYFEIRYRTKPLDPLQWLARR